MVKIVTNNLLSFSHSQDNPVDDKSKFISPIGNAKVVWPQLGINRAADGEGIGTITVIGDSDSFLVDSDGLTFTLTH